MKTPTETLRSSVTPDGQRVFLEFDGSSYRIGTRWNWLARFDRIFDACDAFEAIEMMEGDLSKIAKVVKAEIQRVPRCQFGSKRNTMTRIVYLVNCVEKRIRGLRPAFCGSKGSVIDWRAASNNMEGARSC